MVHLDGIPFPTLMIVVAWDRAYRNTPSSLMLFRGSTQMLSALTRHFICSHRFSGASGGKKTRGDLSVTMKTQMGPEGVFQQSVSHCEEACPGLWFNHGEKITLSPTTADPQTVKSP